MHALVLGATGSSGRALVRYLQGDGRPTEISAVSRSATQLPGVARTWTGHYAGLSGSADFRHWLGSVDVIVHLADGLSALQSPATADADQADKLIAASVQLAGAVRDAKVPLLVYVSSIKAICGEDDGRVLVETSPSRATSLYGRSKLRLEHALAQALSGSGTRLAIVRNPVMYAPGKPGSVARLLWLADTAYPLPFGGLQNRRSLLAIRNLASALATLSCAEPCMAAGTFHIHDGPPLSTTEIVATLREALGRPRRLLNVGHAISAAARHLPLLAPAARRLYGSLELSDAHFRKTFRWTPAVETRAALAEMAASHSSQRGRDAISATVLRRG